MNEEVPADGVTTSKSEICAGSSNYTQAEQDAVIRKLDWNLMPLIFVLYSLSVLDRSNLGNARIAGMAKDIDIAGNRYSWLGTIFYIAYILFQWLQMGWKAFKPHYWATYCIFFWGLISTLQATCTTFGGLMACRFFLGFVEAGYATGVPLYLSFFYPREKLGLRVAVFTSGAALASAYGGILAYGITEAKHAAIPAWKILFIVEGIPTCVLALVAFFWLPDGPSSCRFLTQEQRDVAVGISQSQPGDWTKPSGLQWRQVGYAFLDYRSYLPSLMYFGCNAGYASLPLFIPTIIKEMGRWTSAQSNGLSAPPYAFCFLVIVTTAFVSDRLRLRGPFVAAAALLAAIGYLILATTTAVGARYFGLFLAVLIFVSVSQLLTWVGNTHATDSRRAAGLTVLATGGQCASVLGTNVFPPSEAPYYRRGMWVGFGMCLLTFFAALAQMGVLARDNRERDREYGRDRDTVHLNAHDGSDEEKRFRYVL